MKNISKLSTFIILLLISSCSCVNMNYSKKRINELENRGYKVFFDNKEIKSENLHISKRKISIVEKDNKNKTIKIFPDEDVNMIDAENIAKKTKYSENKNYELVIVNGILYEKANFKNALIELGSINDITILKHEKANNLFDRRFKEDLLIVKTRK